jgi:hypothetical protein
MKKFTPTNIGTFPSALEPKLKRGPTMSFNEVVKKYELNAGKFGSLLRWDEQPPAPAFANRTIGKNTYYDRAAITKWVEHNLEKLK